MDLTKTARRRRASKDETWRNAQDIILHLDEINPRRLRAVMYMRISSKEQRRLGNLGNRVRRLVLTLQRRGISVQEEFQEVCSGKQLEDRPELVRAIEYSRELQAQHPESVVLVITDTRNRFLRGRNSNGNAQSDPPHHSMFKQLENMARGVILATVLPPNATFEEVKRYEETIHEDLGDTGRKGGRPKKQARAQAGLKKTRRDQKLPQARELFEQGISIREIGRRLEVPECTIRLWLA